RGRDHPVRGFGIARSPNLAVILVPHHTEPEPVVDVSLERKIDRGNNLERPGLHPIDFELRPARFVPEYQGDPVRGVWPAAGAQIDALKAAAAVPKPPLPQPLLGSVR